MTTTEVPLLFSASIVASVLRSSFDHHEQAHSHTHTNILTHRHTTHLFHVALLMKISCNTKVLIREMKRAKLRHRKRERESVSFICVWVSVYSENKQSTKRRTQNVAKIDRERERDNNTKLMTTKWKESRTIDRQRQQQQQQQQVLIVCHSIIQILYDFAIAHFRIAVEVRRQRCRRRQKAKHLAGFT